MTKKDHNTYAKLWTEGSILCYNRNCNCCGCPMEKMLESSPCRMNEAVKELLRKFGTPPNEEKALFTYSESLIMDAIIAGCDTFAEIAECLNKPETNIKTLLHHLYQKAKESGWNPKKKGLITGCLLPQFCNYVRNGKWKY